MNRQRVLHHLGLGPVWRLRQPASGGDDIPVSDASASVAAHRTAPEMPAPATEPPSGEMSIAGASPASSGAVVQGGAVAPGGSIAHDGSVARGGSSVVQGGADATATMDWDSLRAAVAECRACGLCQARKQAVLGVGDPEADWLFVGEGPGAEEDERGEPFVGQAGKLLDAMLAAIDLKRGDNVYIANAVKCRPPANRTPEAEETAACWPYLARQIELIRPRLIVALGRPAAQTLLQTEVKIAAARGRVFDYRGIPLIVTYHPAYLLRNLPDKAKAWEDLCFMRRTMANIVASGSG